MARSSDWATAPEDGCDKHSDQTDGPNHSLRLLALGYFAGAAAAARLGFGAFLGGACRLSLRSQTFNRSLAFFFLWTFFLALFFGIASPITT